MPVSKTKTYTNVYVFCFIFQKLILRPYKCPAIKNLQIVTLSISISKTLFGDYGKYASKKKKRLFVKNVKICKKEHSTESEGIRKMFWKTFDFFTAFW